MNRSVSASCAQAVSSGGSGENPADFTVLLHFALG